MIDLNPNSTLVQGQTKWTISRGRDTHGWNICTLYVKGVKVASTCGGNYDMIGTVFGDWIEKEYADHLRTLIKTPHYGLYFLDPDEKTRTDPITSNLPTERHTKPLVDGACGKSCVQKIFESIGGRIKWLGPLGRSEDNERWELFLPNPLPKSEAA